MTETYGRNNSNLYTLFFGKEDYMEFYLKILKIITLLLVICFMAFISVSVWYISNYLQLTAYSLGNIACKGGKITIHGNNFNCSKIGGGGYGQWTKI